MLRESRAPAVRPPRPLWARLDSDLGHLYAGYPALVMATGIISNAFFFENWFGLSQILFFVNLAAYPALMLAFILRLARHSSLVWNDLTNPRFVFSFFTIVAASDVLGIQLDLRGHADAAIMLWLLACLLWGALLYFSFAVLTFLKG